jgi:5-oxoprolinase (ATP-hydrolysing)
MPGANMLIRADGETVALKGRDEIAVEAGDEFLIATPGGGGFGKELA